ERREEEGAAADRGRSRRRAAAVILTGTPLVPRSARPAEHRVQRAGGGSIERTTRAAGSRSGHERGSASPSDSAHYVHTRSGRRTYSDRSSAPRRQHADCRSQPTGGTGTEESDPAPHIQRSKPVF